MITPCPRLIVRWPSVPGPSPSGAMPLCTLLQGKVELLGNALQGVGMAESVHVVQSMLQPREDGAALMELLVAQLFMWFALNAAGASQQERWAHCAMERLGACMMNVMLSEVRAQGSF